MSSSSAITLKTIYLISTQNFHIHNISGTGHLLYISIWLSSNNLKLNMDQTEFLTFHYPFDLPTCAEKPLSSSVLHILSIAQVKNYFHAFSFSYI